MYRFFFAVHTAVIHYGALNMMYDPYSFEAFQERERRHKVKIRRIMLIFLIAFVMVLILYIFLFSKKPLSYDELGMNARIEETSDGNSIVIFSTKEDTPMYLYKGEIGSVSYLDYDTKIDYRDWTFTLYASLWDKIFHAYKDEHDILQSFTTDGVQCEKMEGKWNYTKIIVGVNSENGDSLIFRQLVRKIIYENPDGTTILLWDCSGGMS